ncbi:hypothetical protein MRX96_044074 [Rhipicephalus microplus]
MARNTGTAGQGTLQDMNVIRGRPKQAAPNTDAQRPVDWREKKMEFRGVRKFRACHLEVRNSAARNTGKEAAHTGAGRAAEQEATVVVGLAMDRKRNTVGAGSMKVLSRVALRKEAQVPTQSPGSSGDEKSTEMRGREGKIKRTRSRSRMKSGSRHGKKSRSASSRGSRSRSPQSISRSRSSEGMVYKRSKRTRHHRRSESRGRSRSKRGRESGSTSRRSAHGTSLVKRHKRKKSHHRHRKGRDKSHHRKSHTETASGTGVARKKRVDTVTESYAAQSTPAYLCLLMSSLAATLIMATCVLMVYYIITCRKEVANTSPTPFSGTTTQSKPWHEADDYPYLAETYPGVLLHHRPVQTRGALHRETPERPSAAVR